MGRWSVKTLELIPSLFLFLHLIKSCGLLNWNNLQVHWAVYTLPTNINQLIFLKLPQNFITLVPPLQVSFLWLFSIFFFFFFLILFKMMSERQEKIKIDQTLKNINRDVNIYV